MLKLRVRALNDDGSRGKNSRVLEALSIDYTVGENGTASLKFSVSRNTFQPTVYPFVVGVEYAVGSSNDADSTMRFEQVPHDNLFIVEKDNGDSNDPARVVEYEATPFVPWLLNGSLVHWTTSSKDGKRTWYEPGNQPASAGYTMHGMLTEAKTAGWFPALTWSFNGDTDSNGATWQTAEKAVLSWDLLKSNLWVLETLAEEYMCEWSTTGTCLNLFRPGTRGIDRPNIVLGGQGFERVPVKVDASLMYSHIRAVPDGLPWQNFSSDTSLVPRFGHRSVVLSQSGIKDVASSAKNATPHIEAGKQLLREESYQWTPLQPSDVHPLRDFTVGDQVTGRARGGKPLRRVIGLVFRQTDGVATVQARVGEKIASDNARTRKRLNAISTGGITGGSGEAFPTSRGPAFATPAAPVGLVISSNVGEWLDDGSAASTVHLSWGAVTHAVDGSEIDVAYYEVLSRLPYEASTVATTSYTASAVVELWQPGSPRLASVVAVSSRGVRSEPSVEVPVTPQMPASIVPKAPTGLAVTSNVGAFTAAGAVATVALAWDAVPLSTDDDLIPVSGYVVLTDGLETARVPGTSVSVKLASDMTASYCVCAVGPRGMVGDPSALVPVTGAKPATPASAPTAPVLTSGGGNVFARWNGAYASGGTSGAHSVRVEARVGTSGSWVAQGTLTSAGEQLVTVGAVGETVEVRFLAHDQLGRHTGTSTTASIEVAAIDGANILADSIEGNRIKAGTIQVDHVEPAFGSNLNLSANGDIVLLAGRQDELADEIASTTLTADAARSEASDAAAAAAAANAAAAIADGKALVAQTLATQNAEDIAAQGAVFVVTPTGAEVRSADASNVFSITPAGAAIIQGGSPVSTWDGARLISNELIANRAQLANHVIEKSGTRTVIRAL